MVKKEKKFRLIFKQFVPGPSEGVRGRGSGRGRGRGKGRGRGREEIELNTLLHMKITEIHIFP